MAEAVPQTYTVRTLWSKELQMTVSYLMIHTLTWSSKCTYLSEPELTELPTCKTHKLYLFLFMWQTGHDSDILGTVISPLLNEPFEYNLPLPRIVSYRSQSLRSSYCSSSSPQAKHLFITQVIELTDPA